MDANQTFCNLLRRIESSNLNYVMSKTPFSATISLKSSFVKWFNEDSRCIQNESYDYVSNEEMAQLVNENLKLKAKIKKLEESAEIDRGELEKEKVTEQVAYDNEKRKSEDLDKQIVEYREEVLKLKVGKHNLKANLKTELEKNVALNLETNSLKEKIESLQKSEKEKVKILDVKIAELKLISRKNENLQQELAESQKDLENLKSRQESESKVRYKCEQCEENVETVNQLKLHVGQNHSQSKSSQYDRDQCFEVYPCYYCDQAITCRKDLEDHEIKCIALLDELFQSPEVNIFPCDQCDVISMSMEEL